MTRGNEAFSFSYLCGEIILEFHLNHDLILMIYIMLKIRRMHICYFLILASLKLHLCLILSMVKCMYNPTRWILIILLSHKLVLMKLLIKFYLNQIYAYHMTLFCIFCVINLFEQILQKVDHTFWIWNFQQSHHHKVH